MICAGFRVPRSAFPLRSALRIVAQYADFCNIGGGPNADRGRGNAESRADPAASSPPTSAFRAPRSDFGRVGSQYVTFHMPDAREITPIRLLGETVVPAVAGF
jgi:hypothetical protein